MHQEAQVQTPGEEFGRKAIEEALAKAAAYCGHETERIALEAESRVAARGTELARLRDENMDSKRASSALSPPEPRKTGGGKPCTTGSSPSPSRLRAFSFPFLPSPRTGSAGKATSTAPALRSSLPFA